MNRLFSLRLTVGAYVGILVVGLVGSIVSAVNHDFVHFELEYLALLVLILLAAVLFLPSDAPVLIANTANTSENRLAGLLEQLLDRMPDDLDDDEIWKKWLEDTAAGGTPMRDAMRDAEGRDRLEQTAQLILAGIKSSELRTIEAVEGLPTRVVDFGAVEGRHEGFGAAGAELGTPEAVAAPEPPPPPPPAAAPAKKASAKKAAPVKKAAAKAPAKKVGSAKAPART